jgi:hypothetical protein
LLSKSDASAAKMAVPQVLAQALFSHTSVQSESSLQGEELYFWMSCSRRL